MSVTTDYLKTLIETDRRIGPNGRMEVVNNIGPFFAAYEPMEATLFNHIDAATEEIMNEDLLIYNVLEIAFGDRWMEYL